MADTAASRVSPGPFEQSFLDDLPYDPEVFLFDELLEIDAEADRVRCRMPTPESLPLTRSQRAHPVRHPRHVAGAMMVHASGMLGFVHAYYVLGLRHHEGWVGYGTHLHNVVFRKLVPPGDPIEATGWVVKKRLGRKRHMVRYKFHFHHQGELCYEGEQTAVWMLTSESAPVDRPDPDAVLEEAAR